MPSRKRKVSRKKQVSRKKSSKKKVAPKIMKVFNPKPKDTYKKKTEKDIFKVYYKNPIVHYTPRVVSNMPVRKRQRWDKFLKAVKEIRKEGLVVAIVPLALDKSKNIWWMDYPGDYVSRYGLAKKENRNIANLTVVMKIGDDKKYHPDYDIIIHHDLNPNEKKIAMKHLKPLSFFSWNNRRTAAMYLKL